MLEYIIVRPRKCVNCDIKNKTGRYIGTFNDKDSGLLKYRCIKCNHEWPIKLRTNRVRIKNNEIKRGE